MPDDKTDTQENLNLLGKDGGDGEGGNGAVDINDEGEEDHITVGDDQTGDGKEIKEKDSVYAQLLNHQNRKNIVFEFSPGIRCRTLPRRVGLAEVRPRSQGGVRVRGHQRPLLVRSHQITGAASHLAPEPPEAPKATS